MEDEEYTQEDLTAEIVERDGVPQGVDWTQDFGYNDEGNATLYGALSERDLVYCHTRKTWYHYEDGIWKPDETGLHYRRATFVAEARRDIAFSMEDGSEKNLALKHANHSFSHSARVKMFESAKHRTELAKVIGDFDSNAKLIALGNGVLNLDTCEVECPRPEHFITMKLGANYNPDALCPLWEQTLQEVFGGQDDVIEYVQHVFGSCLEDGNKEQKMFLFLGNGCNGKSLILDIMFTLMGHYAGAIEFDAFNGDNRMNVSPEIASLKGKRFVRIGESESYHRLAEARVKSITAGDLQHCAFKFQNHFTYRPGFKMFLATNHLPHISNADDGIWRRLAVVPFEQSFLGKENRELAQQLKQELDGILNWLIIGYMAWKEVGLHPPQTILAASRGYRADSDILGTWLAERTVEAPGAIMTSSQAYADYSEYRKRQGELSIKHGQFANEMKLRGFKAVPKWINGKTSRTYTGIGLAL